MGVSQPWGAPNQWLSWATRYGGVGTSPPGGTFAIHVSTPYFIFVTSIPEKKHTSTPPSHLPI